MQLVGESLIVLHALVPNDDTHKESIINIHKKCGFKTFGDARPPESPQILIY